MQLRVKKNKNEVPTRKAKNKKVDNNTTTINFNWNRDYVRI